MPQDDKPNRPNKPKPGDKPQPPGPDGGTTVTGKPIPKKFIEKLEKAGLYIDPETNSVSGFPPDFLNVVKGKLGKKELGQLMDIYQKATGRVTDPDKLKLYQAAYERFGLTNTAFDTSLLRYTDRGFVDLRSGVLRDVNGSDIGVVPDERLDLLRARSGYDPQAAYEGQLANSTYRLYEGGPSFTPNAFSSRENWDRYYASVRTNAMSPTTQGPAEEGAAPAPTEESGQSFLGGFDFDSVPTPELASASSSLQQMLQSRQQREAATTGEFFGEDELFEGEF